VKRLILILFSLILINACAVEDSNSCVSVLDCGDPADGWQCIDGQCVNQNNSDNGISKVDDNTSVPDESSDDIVDEMDNHDTNDTVDEITDEVVDEIVDDIVDDVDEMDNQDSDETVDESSDEVPDELVDVVGDVDEIDNQDSDETVDESPDVVADDLIDDSDVDSVDPDGDGWTAAEGDCCELISQCLEPELVNPGAIEVPGDGVDNNCNNETDEELVTCSSTALYSGITPSSLLNAMDICKVSQNDSYGIVGTPELTRADGRDLICTYNMGCGSGLYQKSSIDVQTAVMGQFGTDDSNVAIKGSTMASLSSGRARDADDSPYATEDDTYEWEAYNAAPPADFTAAHGGDLPTTKTGCKAGSNANDSVMLSVQLKVPTNANSFSFNFRFFSQEYKKYTCTQFNDFFIAMLYTGAEGIPDDKNISFDSSGNYISVNTDNFFTVCTPKTGYTCPDGTSALDGTGYGDTYLDPIGRSTYGGGTKWLTTSAPVIPGETITLKFVIWDTGDTQVDSLVLIDNFKWSAEGTGTPVTFECWDKNRNGICDLVDEDLSGDLECSERDCF